MGRLPRLLHLDALAGLAILRVVTLHAKADYVVTGLGRPEILTQHPPGLAWLDGLLRYSVPIFVLLSGIKHGYRRDLDRPGSYRKHLIERLDRIGRPYLAVTLAVLLVGRLMLWLRQVYGLPLMGLSLGPPRLLLERLAGIGNPAYQLWFLVMLLLVSAAYPLVARAVRHPWWRVGLLAGLYVALQPEQAPYPVFYLRYLIVFDLGIAFGRGYRCGLPPHGDHWRRAGRLVGGVLVLTAWWLRPFWLTGLPARAIQATLEIGLPVAALLWLEVLPAGRARRVLVWLGGWAWPIYLLHAPFILGQLGLILWRGLEWLTPWAIPLLATASLATALALGRLVRATPLRRILL